MGEAAARRLLAAGGQWRSSKLLSSWTAELLLGLLLVDSCYLLGGVLIGHLHVGHQVEGLLLVGSPQLVSSGRQAPADVAELLLSQPWPSGCREALWPPVSRPIC